MIHRRVPDRGTSQMPPLRSPLISQILKLLVCLLIGRVLVSTLANYVDYLPPNFDADFLLNRGGYFWGGYHWAFYPHILIGPCTLILGTLLISERFRRRFPRWHRRLGRIQGLCVLMVIAPTGFWMARYAANGPVAGLGFGMLAGASAGTMVLGWRAAVRREFKIHREWMWRCYLLLCSTVIVRVNGGVGATFGITDDWFYAQSAWTSWIVPLLAYEAIRFAGRSHRGAVLPMSSSAG